MAKSAQSLWTRIPFSSKPRTRFQGTGISLSAEHPLEEERRPSYQANHYFPVQPGYIFNRRYEALAKLGWGSASTVWLVRDLQRWQWQAERYLTLKVGNCNSDMNAAAHELRVERQIANADPHHHGRKYVRSFVEHFKETGPDGTHICLAYEPMREPLWILQQRCKNQKLPLAAVKSFMRLLLRGLDYLHSECNVIHTDLKLDNILVSFEHPSVLPDFANDQPSSPMPRKDIDGRTIYLSHSNFGPLRSTHVIPKITDFGVAHHQKEPSVVNRHPIQPDGYMAPEVILGAGWTYSVDIWNLGLLMWNLLENRDLFSHHLDDQGNYRPDAHLAEMIALLGPPPKELLDRGKEGLELNSAGRSEEGRVYRTASELYGGPFFDEKGSFLHSKLIPRDLKIKDTVTSLEDKPREKFLEFATKMLRWLPDDRKTAKELIEDPWLSDESISGDI